MTGRASGGTDDGSRRSAPAGDRIRRVPVRGIRLFSSAADAPRVRRASDTLVLGMSALFLVLLIALHPTRPGPVDRAVAEVLAATAPGILEPIWEAARTIMGFWPLALIVLALASRGRKALVRDAVLATAVALVLTWMTAWAVGVDWPGLGILRPGGSADYPLVALAIAVAAVGALTPHLGRPLRRASDLVVVCGALGSVAVGAARPSGAVVGLLVGVVASRSVLVAMGSSGGLPTAAQIRDSLRDLGVEVDGIEPADEQVAGTYLVRAADEVGPLDVVVCGRDARDAALVASLWRQVWYRPETRSATSSRLHQVEQEAFVTLLAHAAGLAVPTVVTAGMARTGDAVLVTRPAGTSLERSEVQGSLDLAGLWALLAALHDVAVVHGSLDVTTVGLDPTGAACIVRMAGASTAVTELAVRTDEVQVLTATAAVVGVAEAVEAARAALGDDGLAALLPYLQPAVLSRPALDRDEDHLLDDLASAITAATGAESPDLVKLRRVTWGTVGQAALFLLAGYALVVGLGSLDLAQVWDELQDASVPLLIAALVVAQTPRPLQAVSTRGASTADLPLGPLAALQLAISYINLAVPSAAGRLAITIRFFQKLGVDRVTAVAIGAIDSAAGFAVQILILVVIGVTGASDVSLGVLGADVELGPIIVVAVVVAAAVAGVVLAVSSRLRDWLRDKLSPALSALQVLRDPRKVAQLFVGNIASQIMFAAALALCVDAVGAEVAFVDVLMANTLVSLFAGLLPVPGGIGVTEAGLTAALAAAGVPQESALAAVIIYRVWSFYLPPVWGFFAMRSLQRRSYL